MGQEGHHWWSGQKRSRPARRYPAQTTLLEWRYWRLPNHELKGYRSSGKYALCGLWCLTSNTQIPTSLTHQQINQPDVSMISNDNDTLEHTERLPLSVFWFWGFCAIFEVNLSTTFRKPLWVLSSLIMLQNVNEQDGTHSGLQIVFGKLTSHTMQKHQKKKTIFITRWKSKIKKFDLIIISLFLQFLW
jgi:hypothetical protein